MKELITYLIVTIGLIVAAFVVFRVFVRNDYKRKGRLSPFSCFLQFFLFFLHALSSYVYIDPYFTKIDAQSPYFIPAVTCIAIGLVLLVISMIQLGLGDTVGTRMSGLRQSGLYRYTRNPGLVASIPLYIGFVLLWPAWTGIIWIGVLWVMFYIMVLTEEEHLKNIFGDEYESYCKKTPRFIGLRKKNTRCQNY